MNAYGFSDVVPTLRLAWDATMLTAYMRDPLTYFWKHVQGYGTPRTNNTLSFGTIWHEATGAFDAATYAGADRVEALRAGIARAKEKADEMGLPYTGKKGDEAKRNLRTLLRALIWWEQDTLHRKWRALPNGDGSPAIEVRFVLPLGVRAYTGEEFVLCGSFDSAIEDEDGNAWVLERKTTTKTLGPFFWQTYDPCMQTYLYDYVAPQLYPERRLRGVIVEAMQTGVEFSRSETHNIVRTDEQRAHWHEVMLYWMRRAEQDARDDAWKRALNCEATQYGSIYKDIQKRDPRVWQALLNTDLEKRELWNPLSH